MQLLRKGASTCELFLLVSFSPIFLTSDRSLDDNPVTEPQGIFFITRRAGTGKTTKYRRKMIPEKGLQTRKIFREQNESRNRKVQFFDTFDGILCRRSFDCLDTSRTRYIEIIYRSRSLCRYVTYKWIFASRLYFIVDAESDEGRKRHRVIFHREKSRKSREDPSTFSKKG